MNSDKSGRGKITRGGFLFTVSFLLFTELTCLVMQQHAAQKPNLSSYQLDNILVSSGSSLSSRKIFNIRSISDQP